MMPKLTLQDIYAEREKAKDEHNPVIRDESFELLINTVKKYKPKRILEIGSNVGLSSIAMLLSSEGSKLTGIEIAEDRKKRSEDNFIKFGVKDRAKVFLGDASEILPILTGEYDFIFLDGPKGHYFEYLNSILPILSKGGVLFADNVLFRGYVLGTAKMPHRFATAKHSLESFLNVILHSENLKTEIIDIEDGISITQKIN